MKTFKVKISAGTTTHSVVVYARNPEEAIQEAARILNIKDPDGTVIPMDGGENGQVQTLRTSN